MTPRIYYQDPNVTLYCGDAFDVLPQIEMSQAVITDPPYPNEFDRVWDALGKPAFDACDDNAFLVTLCGHYQLCRVLDAVRAGGWKWYWNGIASNRNQPIMHGFKVKCCHKPMPIFRKGSADPVKYWFDDASLRTLPGQWDDAQDAHKWGQADGVFWEPIMAFTNEGDTVLDPFCGGASIAVACIKLRRKYIGVEIDQTTCEIAIRRIRKCYDDMALLHPPPQPIVQGEMFK